MTMPRYEREQLERLTRDRERIAKGAAEARVAEMKADVERKLSAVYSFNQSPVWKKLHDEAEAVVRRAQAGVAEECDRLGIPPQFAPHLEMSWYGRGENAVAARRAELRNAAYAEIDALLKNAKTQISLAASAVRVKLLSGSLESEEAKQFLASMPTVDALMPMLSLEDIEKKTPTPRWMLQ